MSIIMFSHDNIKTIIKRTRLLSYLILAYF